MYFNMQHHLLRKWGHHDKRNPKGSERGQECVQEGQEVPEQGEARQAVGEGEAVDEDRDQREGGEDAGRVRGEIPIHAAGRVQLQYQYISIYININNNCDDI